MAFTAGSIELAKAEKLALQLSALYQTFGASQFVGTTAAIVVEDYAQKLGFGITGLTTAGGFPPFGTANPTLGLGIEAALQNVRGETMANGITLGAFEGQTVGIYLKKFMTSGAGYEAVLRTGVTLSVGATSGAGTTFVARGPVSVSTYDTLDFGDGTVYTVRGFTSAASGETAHIGVWNTITSTYATGAAFSVLTTGVTRGTVGVAGITSESYTKGNIVNGGYTAAVFFGAPAGGSAYFAVS